MSDFDVIVVGGGPAGSGLATHLARDGWSVLLLDRARFPRDKPCGEFFSPPVRGLLTRLGVWEDIYGAGVRDIRQAVLHCGGAEPTGTFTHTGHPNAPEGGFSVERRVLDNLLWRNAVRSGVDAHENVAVRGLLRADSGAVVGVRTDRGDVTARLVVGADGARSRVARDLDLHRPIPRLQKVALVTHYAGLPPDAPGTIEMFVDSGRHRVCGVGAGPCGTANVTLVVSTEEARAVAEAGAEAFADQLIGQSFPEVAERLCGATRTRLRTTGTHGHTVRSPVADGALLTGDAACFIDPFTGEGVYFALRGAELAAETVTHALRRGDTSARALRGYALARRRELAPKYAVCDMVQWAVHTPGLIGGIAPKLARNPRLMDRILSVTGDMASPLTLLSPGFLWRLATA